MKSYPGPPMTLGNAAAAKVTLIVWCKDCRHQVEPDPAEMAARYGAETSVPTSGGCIRRGWWRGPCDPASTALPAAVREGR
jgi:hypothetical protein